MFHVKHKKGIKKVKGQFSDIWINVPRGTIKIKQTNNRLGYVS